MNAEYVPNKITLDKYTNIALKHLRSVMRKRDAELDGFEKQMKYEQLKRNFSRYIISRDFSHPYSKLVYERGIDFICKKLKMDGLE